MFNWLNLSDRALMKSANHIAAAEAAIKSKDSLNYQLNTVDAYRYQLISKYCLIRWRRLFA
jgi:hypothetical protein